MDTTQMTVAQITALLSQQDISLHIINRLKIDARLSVKRLVDKWEARRQNAQREWARIQALYEYERQLKTKGHNLVAGVDEAGRGPLAGPVLVAAVILPLECYLPGLNDSKKLTAIQRERLYQEIKNAAIAVKSCVVSVETIDDINIYQATIGGMYSAISSLSPAPQAVLVDAVPLPKLVVPHQAIIGGDQVSASIAAASIIAKVERDQIMNELDSMYPMYGFIRHKGYGTQEHMEALARYGPCPYHRRSFAPVKAADISDR
ncbi:ribonuclease HII [Sporomusa malonica]|uniref:Ribonuclease HII n=1 Tax=Sporomusa malonica TaxID=112901 RepID=A0A1W2B2T1_9FIRM|nr:ribonuclease HII [Sporomusa malonica]SMC67041.1 RNase HII [Sporomusa malonica]